MHAHTVWATTFRAVAFSGMKNKLFFKIRAFT